MQLLRLFLARVAFRDSVVLFLAAEFIRLGFVLVRGPYAGPDTVNLYAPLAGNLATLAAYTLDTAPPFVPASERGPGYPLFLAALGAYTAESLGRAVIVQTILDSLIAVAVYLLAAPAVSRALAFGAAALYALHPGPVFFASAVLSETVFAAALVGGLVALNSGLSRQTVGLTALAGVALGFAGLTRPIGILLAIALLGVVVWPLRRPRHAFIGLAFFLLVVGPWTVRTSLLAGGFVPVVTNSAVSLYLPTRLDWNQQATAELFEQFYYGDDAYGRAIAEARSPRDLAAADRFGVSQTIKNISMNPLDYLAKRAHDYPFLLVNSFDSFTGIHRSFGELLKSHEFLLLLVKAALLALFSLVPIVLGVAGAFRGRRPIGVLCSTLWVTTAVAFLPLYVEYRYWIPVTAPLLVSAAVAVNALRHDGFPLRRARVIMPSASDRRSRREEGSH